MPQVTDQNAYVPTGNPMLDGVGPGSWADREDVPELNIDKVPAIVPLRVAEGTFLEPRDPDPRGMKVIGADREIAGVVTDVWVDRAEALRPLTEAPDADYWYQNLRAPVRFAQTVSDALKQGLNLWLEISPHPLLLQTLQASARVQNKPILTVSSLKRAQPEALSLRQSLVMSNGNWTIFVNRPIALALLVVSLLLLVLAAAPLFTRQRDWRTKLAEAEKEG